MYFRHGVIYESDKEKNLGNFLYWGVLSIAIEMDGYVLQCIWLCKSLDWYYDDRIV